VLCCAVWLCHLTITLLLLLLLLLRRSLAKLRYRPPASSLQQLCESSLALMTSPPHLTKTPSHSSHPPSHLSRTQSHFSTASSCSAQDLSLTAYSFALLGYMPPDAWWSRFWASSRARMGQASSQALANMFWALGRLRKVGETGGEVVGCRVAGAGQEGGGEKQPYSQSLLWVLLLLHFVKIVCVDNEDAP
jgi:hypothetical protein